MAKQVTDYNGYHHDTMCNNVFYFSLGHCKTHKCKGLIDMFLEYICRYKICVDQGFPKSEDMFDKFVGPKSESTRKNMAPNMRRTILQQYNM